MELHRELFKQAISRPFVDKRAVYIRGNKDRRSLAFDLRRPLDVLPAGRNITKKPKRNYIKENILRLRRERKNIGAKKAPFVVGIVRHKVHSPPFLATPLRKEKARKKLFTAQIESFAPKNHKFHPPKGLQIIQLTKKNSISKGTKDSPFNLSVLCSKATPQKNHVFENITVRSAVKNKFSPGDFSPLTDIGNKNNDCDKNNYDIIRKQLWPSNSSNDCDPDEPPLFGQMMKRKGKRRSKFNYDDENKENICPNSTQSINNVNVNNLSKNTRLSSRTINTIENVSLGKNLDSHANSDLLGLPNIQIQNYPTDLNNHRKLSKSILADTISEAENLKEPHEALNKIQIVCEEKSKIDDTSHITINNSIVNSAEHIPSVKSFDNNKNSNLLELPNIETQDVLAELNHHENVSKSIPTDSVSDDKNLKVTEFHELQNKVEIVCEENKEAKINDYNASPITMNDSTIKNIENISSETGFENFVNSDLPELPDIQTQSFSSQLNDHENLSKLNPIDTVSDDKNLDVSVSHEALYKTQIICEENNEAKINNASHITMNNSIDNTAEYIPSVTSFDNNKNSNSLELPNIETQDVLAESNDHENLSQSIPTDTVPNDKNLEVTEFHEPLNKVQIICEKNKETKINDYDASPITMDDSAIKNIENISSGTGLENFANSDLPEFPNIQTQSFLSELNDHENLSKLIPIDTVFDGKSLDVSVSQESPNKIQIVCEESKETKINDTSCMAINNNIVNSAEHNPSERGFVNHKISNLPESPNIEIHNVLAELNHHENLSQSIPTDTVSDDNNLEVAEFHEPSNKIQIISEENNEAEINYASHIAINNSIDNTAEHITSETFGNQTNNDFPESPNIESQNVSAESNDYENADKLNLAHTISDDKNLEFTVSSKPVNKKQIIDEEYAEAQINDCNASHVVVNNNNTVNTAEYISLETSIDVNCDLVESPNIEKQNFAAEWNNPQNLHKSILPDTISDDTLSHEVTLSHELSNKIEMVYEENKEAVINDCNASILSINSSVSDSTAETVIEKKLYSTINPINTSSCSMLNLGDSTNVKKKVAHVIPVPTIVIDLHDSPSTIVPPIKTKKSVEIETKFQLKQKKINVQLISSNKKSNEVVDLVSDEEDDYTTYLAKIKQSHALQDLYTTTENGKRIILNSMEKNSKPLNNLPKISPTHIKNSLPEKSLVSSPVRLLSLRSRNVSVTPSPKRTPRRPKATPSKTPQSQLAQNKTSVDFFTPSPVRVLSLRKRNVSITPSPKKQVQKKLFDTPQKVPQQQSLKEKSPEETVLNPYRILTLRSRQISVSPSPKKKTSWRKKN